MSKTVIFSPRVAAPTAPYSMATFARDTMYVSGLVPVDQHGEPVGVGDIRAQTTRVLEIMRELIASTGGQMSDVVKTTVYLTNVENYSEMNDVYRSFFPKEAPAR